MSPARVIVASALFGAIAVTQVVQGVLHRDDWPFSSYPMYSTLQQPVTTVHRLLVVTAQGEVEATSEETQPIAGSRLRKALSSDAKSTVRALIPTVCMRRESAGAPEMTALRVYRKEWKIKPSLKGIDARGKQILSLPVLCPGRRTAIEKQQLEGGATPAAQVSAGAGAVVFEAQNHQLNGAAPSVTEPTTDSAPPVVGVAPPKSKARSGPAGWRVEFEVPAGTYYLWLRTQAGPGSPSVWAQVDQELGTTHGTLLEDLSNPAPGYPSAAYAWSSAKPGHKPVAFEWSKPGKHQLLLTPREGRVVIDQIVLSPEWSEHPVHNLRVGP